MNSKLGVPVILAAILLLQACARYQESRETRVRRQMESHLDAYREVVASLPDDPEIGVPMIAPFYVPDDLAPHLLRRDYELLRSVSTHMVASSIDRIKFDDQADRAVSTLRYLRRYEDGREDFGSFNIDWCLVRGKWLLGLDNWWSDSSSGGQYVSYGSFDNPPVVTFDPGTTRGNPRP